MPDVVVLGAEAQAASSLACAYPERTFAFVSDHAILDGWDLPNVRIVPAQIGDGAAAEWAGTDVVPLCPRWLAHEHALPLSTVFVRLEHASPGLMVPTTSSIPEPNGRWVLKGDRWHRPDATLVGSADQLDGIDDPHGCGVVFQPACRIARTVMTIGRRSSAGTQLGCIQVLDERFFWDNILQAGESVAIPTLVEASLKVLDVLGHQGFFTLNWLQTEHKWTLSSMRPVPRAIFQMFRHSGVDLLEEAAGTRVVQAGLRMIATPTYTSYRIVGT